VHVILGGRSKGTAFHALAPVVAQHSRAAYLIGEAADALEAALGGAGTELHRCGDLEHAVAEAARRAMAGEVVLLAPACASFDAYRDYEERGEHFRRLVQELER
jgi:UDP-N-acetylmuramoylalanine--D-glutamate ligase